MNFVDALAHVEAGHAGEHIERFINNAIFQMLQATVKNEHSQEIEDAFVTAIALLRMENLPQARQFMGKKRRPRGDSFKASKLFTKFPHLSDAVDQYLSGQIDRANLLEKFAHAIEDEFGKQPDAKTVDKVVGDYLGRHALAHQQIDVFTNIADGDPLAAQAIFRRFIGYGDDEK